MSYDTTIYMSSPVSPGTAPTVDGPLANILFDYPGADVIFRSQDSYHFRVPKIYIENSSPVLSELIRKILDSPGVANALASLPVIQLPKRGEIIHCILTFIFPVIPLLPSTPEEAMELLSEAQAYQMGPVLSQIRDRIARYYPQHTHLEPVLRIYSLAQKYRLRPEALQTARTILKYPITIEDFYDKLDIMPGTSLYELWKYYEGVRAILASDLTEFRESTAHGTITGLCCTSLSSSQIPTWIDHYIESIGNMPHLFDLVEFNAAMSSHVKANAAMNTCECASIPSQTIRKFWEALASVVHDGFDKAESVLSLVHERQDPQAQINPAASPPPTFDVPDASIIIQSSDLVDFRVHKSVLAMTSPFFNDLLSLPQPSDSETVDGLPVVQLSENSELLNSLVSILYPIRMVIPSSYEKVLYLLAACQKYEMASVQSFIRDEVNRGAFPTPKGAEAFSAYAIASGKGLVPEMETTARQTLDHPMTFEVLGEGLRLFDGWALRDLANFRRRYRDHLVSCLESFLKTEEPQFKIWTPCASYTLNPGAYDPYYGYSTQSSYSLSNLPMSSTNGSLPSWLAELYQKHLAESCGAFSNFLFNPRSIRGEYLSALQAHMNSLKCVSCTEVHIEKGETFCKDLEDRLTQALNEVLLDLI